MTKTVEALFDGKVLRPDEPLELQPNTRVRITIESSVASGTKRLSFLRTARSLKLDGPSNWSERIDDYLYGNGNDA